MLSLLGLVLPGLFNTISSLTNAISNAKIAAITATTQQEQIAAQERVNTLQAQRDVLIADSTHSSLDIWLRTFIAIGPAAYLTKIFLWDKTFQTWTLGSTDDLTAPQWEVVMAVVGFYFLYSGAVGVAKIMKA